MILVYFLYYMNNTQYSLRNFNETKIMIVLYKKKFDSLDNNLIIYQFYYNFYL